MKVHELMDVLSQLDQDTEIKIGHIRQSGPNYNTEIDPTNLVIRANAPD